MSRIAQAIGGVKSAAGYTILINFLQFASTVVIARSLSNSDYAVISIFLPLVAALYLFCDAGFTSSIIQTDTKNLEVLSGTVLTISTLVTVLIVVTILMFRYEISNFFTVENLETGLLAISFILLVKMYTAVLASIEVRKMNYRNEVVSRFIGSLVGTITVFSSMLFDDGLLVVLFAYCINPLASGLYIIRSNNWKIVSFRFNKIIFLSIWKYALNLFLSNLLYFFSKSGINLVAAKLFSGNSYSNYFLANQFAGYPRTAFTSIFFNILLNTFSAEQHNQNKLRVLSLVVMKWAGLLICPQIIFLIVISESLFFFIYGANFKLASEIFNVLGLVVCMSIIGSIPAICLQAVGSTQFLLRANIIRVPFIILIILLFLYLDFGIMTFATLIVMTEIIPLFYLLEIYRTRLGVKYVELIAHSVLFPIIYAIISSIYHYVFEPTSAVSIIQSYFVCGLLYVLVLALVSFRSLSTELKFIRSKL